MAGKASIILGIGLSDKVIGEIDKLAGKWRAKFRGMASIGSELSMGLTLPLVAAGAGLLKFTADLDAMKRALAANMGSAKAAGIEFEKLKIIAKAPGISLEGAVKGSYTLQGLGASADQARYQMEGLAKAVALSGGGEEQFQGLMTQFTQMIGSGKILQQDIRFMKENAPILSKVMAEVFGSASPDRIRQLVTVDQFVQKLSAHLHEMDGISGSVKNSLENMWQYFKIGVGEIGLAILEVTGFGTTIDQASDKVEDITRNITEWVKKHGELTTIIIKSLGAMAVTGPIIRFISNLGLMVSMALSAISAISGVSKALLGLNAIKLTAILAVIWAVGEALNYIERKFTYFMHWAGKETLRERHEQHMTDISGTVANDRAAARGKQGYKESASMGAYSDFIPGFEQPDIGAMFGPGKYFMAGGGAEAAADPTGVDWIAKLAAKVEESLKGPKTKLEKYNYREHMGDFIPEGPYGGGFSTDEDKPKDTSGFHFEKIDTSSFQNAAKIGIQYDEALKRITTDQKLGSTTFDDLQVKIDSAAEAYRGMVEIGAAGSQQAQVYLDEYKKSVLELTNAQRDQAAEQEKLNKLMELSQMIMGGISDAVSGMFQEGAKGMDAFIKGVLKAVAALMKLAIVTYIGKVLAGPGGFLAAIPAIIGGGVLIGLMEGLLNKISAAEGGIITGETLIRAGEYPGASGANPEVIQPLSKLKQLLGDMGGGNVVQVVGVLRGDDIHLQTSKAQTRAMRRGSGNVITF